jgi:hypothetical protein
VTPQGPDLQSGFCHDSVGLPIPPKLVDYFPDHVIRLFCSLANNLGALTLIAENAEEEDVKEDMLLYAFLAQSPSHEEALSEARAAISGFPKERCEASVGYDAEDALRRLLADGLVKSDADGNLTAIAPTEARDHLDALWDRLLDVDSLDKAACPAKA